MIVRIAATWLAVVGPIVIAGAQTVPTARPVGRPIEWHAPGVVRQASAQSPNAATAAPSPPGPVARAAPPPIARVSKGSGTLPNDHGQVWREYDISPYTLRITSTPHPERAIVDWILRETGYEAWHSVPVGLLCADRRTLRVYHTPEMQATVSNIVDRFVDSRAESNVFSLRIIAIGSPNWRSTALPLMKPVPVQTQGVQGWLLAKEDAALLLAGLQKRSDFRERSSPQMVVNNGQSTVVSAMRPRMYVRGLIPSGGVWPGFNPDVAQIDEGYSLQFSPLLSLDGKTVDAVIKLELTQVERMVPVMLDVPSAAAQRQRTRIEIPQLTMSHIRERFRWPTDQVLLLSMGVIASPDGARGGNAITNALSLGSSPPRSDALLLIESKGRIVRSAATTPVAPRASARY